MAPHALSDDFRSETAPERYRCKPVTTVLLMGHSESMVQVATFQHPGLFGEMYTPIFIPVEPRRA